MNWIRTQAAVVKAWAKKYANHVRGAIGAGVAIVAQAIGAATADEVVRWGWKRWTVGIGLVVLAYAHGWLTPTPKPVLGSSS
jgi:hypothetical protein